MADEKVPTPPKDLTPESARWWTDTASTYEFRPHHLKLLTSAARLLDRADSARQALKKQGLTYLDRHGVKRPSPECLIERNSVIAFARLLRELRLDNMEDADEARLPRNTKNWQTRNDEWRKK